MNIRLRSLAAYLSSFFPAAILGACLAIGPGTLVGAQAETPVPYGQPQVLPEYPGSQYTWAYRLNDAGVIVGYARLSASEYAAVYYAHPGATPNMLVDHGTLQYLASGVNNAGHAVGGDFKDANLWTDIVNNPMAPSTQLPWGPFMDPAASGINDACNMVGRALGYVGPGPYKAVSPYPYPIYWADEDVDPVALKLPSTDYCATSVCSARDINNRQEIVGDRCGAASCDTLYWSGPDAVPVPLPNASVASAAGRREGGPAAKAAYANLVANGVNEARQVVGASVTPGGAVGPMPLVWMTRSAVGPVPLPLGGLSWAMPYGINNHGVISGTGFDPVAGRNVPVIWNPAPNYQGLWWRSPAGSESGWGVNVNHEGNIVFATWFTFDLDGNPWWLVVSAVETAPGSGVFTGDLYTGTGPPFSSVPFDPTAVQAVKVGTATFTFTDNDNGSFAYTVNGVSQVKPITKQVFGAPVPTCIWGAEPNLALVAHHQALWWAAPAGTESGWGINLTQQGNVIFASWFTFGPDGKPWWLVISAIETAPGSNVYTGDFYTGTGPPFNSEPFDPAAVHPVKVGTGTFTFADGNHASFAYTVNGVSQVKEITRELLGAIGTMCH